SVRTERGPRQNVVAWLGAQDEAGRLGVLQAARCIDRDPASNVDSTKFHPETGGFGESCRRRAAFQRVGVMLEKPGNYEKSRRFAIFKTPAFEVYPPRSVS
ncbi:MAG TPA: hypothetical protein VM260_14020, partial [Pirellula sp.]|nr:hypothetical protein [Pirellula sp.]